MLSLIDIDEIWENVEDARNTLSSVNIDSFSSMSDAIDDARTCLDNIDDVLTRLVGVPPWSRKK